MSFLGELQRRNVIKVAVAYLVAAWLLLQVTEVLVELLELPTSAGRFVIMLLALGFFPALLFAWIYELTPEGIKRESEIDRTDSITPQTGRKLNVAIIGMLVATAGYFFWESRLKDDVPAPAPTVAAESPAPAPDAVEDAPPQVQSIAVLPFVNMSNDPEQEFFSDGLSEEILNALAKIGDLRVISRTSAFAFKGKDVSIPDIAAQLDVTHVLEGSVRTAGTSVRITAQLIEVDSDSHLWSEAYNRELANVFEIQEEISKAIAAQLEVRLVDSGPATAPTTDLEAYQLYLRGRHLYQSRDQEKLRRAVALIEQAVELDPTFDEAWATLAAARTVYAFNINDGYDAEIAAAVAAVDRALALNPDNSLANGVSGLHLLSDLRFEEALAALTRAIEANPTESNNLLWRALGLQSLGYVEASLADLKRAEAVDPVFVNVHNWLMSTYVSLGDAERARHHFNLMTELDPGFEMFGQSDLLQLEGDLDGAETVAVDELSHYLSEAQTRAIYAALRDPATTDTAIALLREPVVSNSAIGIFIGLFRIGAVQEGVDAWRRGRERGRKLESVNGLTTIWGGMDRSGLDQAALMSFFEEFGLAAYWRQHGAPDFCRAEGDGFVCGG